MLIKNYNQLATNKMRKEVLDIIEAGIEAVEPNRMFTSALSYNEDFNSIRIFNKSYDMMRGRIFVIGGGKASGAMAEAFEKIVGPEKITAGVVACKDTGRRTKKIKLYKAGHPFPDWRSVWTCRRMLGLKKKYGINEKDLVVCLMSGGASALLASPVEAVNLSDKQKAARLLLGSGANIGEVNIVRKHLSKIKGGQLANFFAPAKILTLVISDVSGDKLEVIGSGPTVPDPTTFKDALFVLEKYRLIDKVPSRVRDYIKLGSKGGALETPKSLDNADNYIIGNNLFSLEAMSHKAISSGLKPIIVGNDIGGEPNVTAYKIVRHIMQSRFEGYDVLLYAGETNPTLPEKYGQGGRNQQFAAASMLALGHLKRRWAMASISSDGIDFDMNVAGALVDSDSYQKTLGRGIDIAPFVRSYNTYNLFKKMGNSLVHTGNTGTNVADLIVYRLGR
jgi:glycerate 2-kinase